MAKQVAWSWKWTALRRLERCRALSRLAASAYLSPLPGGCVESGMAGPARPRRSRRLPGVAGAGRKSARAGGRKSSARRAEVCEGVRARRGVAEMVAAKRKRDAPAARPKKRVKRVPGVPEPGAEPDAGGAGLEEYSIPPPVSQVPPRHAGQGRVGRAVPGRVSLSCAWPGGGPRLRARAGP